MLIQLNLCCFEPSLILYFSFLFNLQQLTCTLKFIQLAWSE